MATELTSDKAWIRVLFRRNRRLFLAILAVLPFVLVSLFSPVLPLRDPSVPNPAKRHLPPNSEYWFGTDSDGMDVFSRVLHGARIDFGIALTGVLIGILLGAPLGAWAAYTGGVFENCVERFAEMIQAFPMVLFAMLMAILMGKGILTLFVVLALYNVPFYAKVVRSIVKPLVETDFIAAARCCGLRPPAIVFRHLLPNAFAGIMSQFPLSCASGIRAIATLSFVGLGITPPTAEWGSMIYVGANYIVFGEWWPSLFPGLALFLAVLALNNLGDALQEVLRGGR